MNTDKKQEIAEALLVLRAQLREDEAFSSLVRRYSRAVHSYLARFVGTTSADDVLQQTWLKVHRSLVQLQEPRAFKGWLFRIAHGEAISWLRRTGRQLPLDEDCPEEEVLTWTSGDPISALSVQQVLERLAPKERELLRLRFELGLTYEELADSLEINVGTVRSRLHYTKNKARTLLKGGSSQ